MPKAPAIWFRIWGLFGVVLAALEVILSMRAARAAASAGASMSAREFWGVLSVGGALMALFVVLGVLGSLLARYRNGARRAALVMSVLVLLFCVREVARVSGAWDAVLAIGVFGWAAALVWALGNARSATLCTERYLHRVARTPALVPRTFRGPFFWVPLILTTLGAGSLILRSIG